MEANLTQSSRGEPRRVPARYPVTVRHGRADAPVSTELWNAGEAARLGRGAVPADAGVEQIFDGLAESGLAVLGVRDSGGATCTARANPAVQVVRAPWSRVPLGVVPAGACALLLLLVPGTVVLLRVVQATDALAPVVSAQVPAIPQELAGLIDSRPIALAPVPSPAPAPAATVVPDVAIPVVEAETGEANGPVRLADASGLLPREGHDVSVPVVEDAGTGDGGVCLPKDAGPAR